MKICILLVLSGLITSYATDIKTDVEEIINSEFTSHCELTLHKYSLPDELKTKTENQVRQKFFDTYVYVWKICQQDSLQGFAVLDNTYGKSQPITFLAIYSPTGKIIRVDIIRYREPYGGAISSRRWLNQFSGKSGHDKFKVDKDIDSISGATISVNSVTRGVYKLSLLMESIISKKVFNYLLENRVDESNAKKSK